MNLHIRLPGVVVRLVGAAMLVLAGLLLLPWSVSGENGTDESGASSWMRVYTTGRQPLTPYPEGTPLDPAGHLVGTDVVVMPSGDFLVAAYVGDPGSPSARAALGRIAPDGSVMWSREYFTTEPSTSQQPDPWHAHYGGWPRLVALPDREDIAYALAFGDTLLFVDDDGLAVHALRFPAMAHMTGLLALPDGGLALVGVSTPSTLSGHPAAVHLLRLALHDGSQPELLWAKRIDGLVEVWPTPHPRPDVVRTPDGSLWVGAADAFLVCLSEQGDLLGSWSLVPQMTAVHGGHGLVRDLKYGALATDGEGRLLFGGSLGVQSQFSSATSVWAFVTCLDADPDGVDVIWASALAENTGYGLRSVVHDLQVTTGAIFVTGPTAHWGQDEGFYNDGAYVARLGKDGSVTWVRLLGRKKQSAGQTEYSDDRGHAMAPTADGGAVLAGGTSSFSHPEPWRQTVQQAFTSHPELLVAVLGSEGEVKNIGFGRYPNLGLAPELGDRVRQVDVLKPVLIVEEAELSIEDVVASGEAVIFETRDGGWSERSLSGQRYAGDHPPTAVIHLPEPEEDRMWDASAWFDASGSWDPDGGYIVRVLWDFGDGKTSTALKPYHRYPEGGAYVVTLTVTDEQGYEGTASRTVRVGKVLRGASYPVALDSGATTTYQVEILTGDAQAAGTDAEVRLTLLSSANGDGEREGSGDLVLDAAHHTVVGAHPFKRDALDTFLLPDSPKVRDVAYAVLRHDNEGGSPGWQVMGVRVTDVQSKEQWLFVPERWLGTDKSQRTWSRLVPVRPFPAGILFGGETRSHNLIAASGSVFILPPGCTEFYITTADRAEAIAVFDDQGLVVGTHGERGSGQVRFPYLQEGDWGVRVAAERITHPTALTVRLDRREGRVWVFPSHWEGHLQEALAVTLLLPLRGRTSQVYGALYTPSGEPASNITRIEQILKRCAEGTALYDVAMGVVLPYAAEAIGIFGALPDDLLEGRISIDVGIFVADRLANALSIVGVAIASELMTEFTGLLTGVLSAALWAEAGFASVISEAGAAMGANHLLSVLPDYNTVFKQVRELWRAMEIDIRLIVGTHEEVGLAWQNDTWGTRVALERIRALAVGTNPDGMTLADHCVDYEDYGVTPWVSGAEGYSLSLLLLLELRNTELWSRGDAPSWRPTTLGSEVEQSLQGMGYDLGLDPGAEAEAAMTTYRPIWEEIIRISSVLVDASLLLRP